MFLEEKVKSIDEKLELIKDKKNIVVWGAGEHTEALFKYTKILELDIKHIVDKYNYGYKSFSFDIIRVEDVKWEEIQGVIISSHKYQENINAELFENIKFKGIIIKLYDENERNLFFKLQSYDKKNIIFTGNYNTWNEAEKECNGYGEENILNKCIEAVRQVRNGQAYYERDSVLFYKKEHSHHLITFMLKSAIKNGGSLKVLDFGGALGSTYYQNVEILSDSINDIKWYIVEQKSFFEYGKANLEDDVLHFEECIENIAKITNIDVVLISGAIQYIENYIEVINEILNVNAEYIILDRTLCSDQDRICIQEVPEIIYRANYPVRIFNKKKLLELFEKKYKLISELDNDEFDIHFNDTKASFKGFVFKRIL